MKCDDFLPWLETGGMLRRWLAGRHAAKCGRCAAVRDTWIEAKRQLIAPEPPTADLRRMWQQAAGETARLPHLERRWYPMPAAVVAAACVLVVAVAVIAWKVNWWQSVEPVTNGQTALASAPIEVVDRTSEFANLEIGVQQLRAEVDLALADAQRLDARRQAEELLDRYSKW